MFTFEPLWKTLSNKGLTKTQLREMTGISTATLSKLSKNEYVSMQVLEQICKALQVSSITDVMEFGGGTWAIKTIDTIEQIINRLANNKISNTKPDDEDIFRLYLTMEDFVENQIYNETEDIKDKFISLYSKCFTEKLLPDDLLDELNKMLKKYLL